MKDEWDDSLPGDEELAAELAEIDKVSFTKAL